MFESLKKKQIEKKTGNKVHKYVHKSYKFAF